MKTAKQETLDLVEKLPDDVPMETILYRLHLKAKVERGLRQLDAGETVPHQQVVEDLERWLTSIGQ
jgi:predicted transcriptional regulator